MSQLWSRSDFDARPGVSDVVIVPLVCIVPLFPPATVLAEWCKDLDRLLPSM